MSCFLKFEFNGIALFFKNDARYERLVKGDFFISNTKIHSIQHK